VIDNSKGKNCLEREVNMPNINMDKTGENIKKLRLDSGLSVKEIQNIFGFGTPNAIYKWQKGNSLPTVDNLVVLAKIFKCSIDDILVLN
jgi:transcriptional regulator with XRE-family HTH domain